MNGLGNPATSSEIGMDEFRVRIQQRPYVFDPVRHNFIPEDTNPFWYHEIGYSPVRRFIAMAAVAADEFSQQRVSLVAIVTGQMRMSYDVGLRGIQITSLSHRQEGFV